MTEPKHFQKLQSQFFKDYAKKVEVQSSQILFTCFHPTAQVKGDVILMLEQQFYPAGQKVYDLVLDQNNSVDNESFESSTVEELGDDNAKDKKAFNLNKKSQLKDESPFIHTQLASQRTGIGAGDTTSRQTQRENDFSAAMLKQDEKSKSLLRSGSSSQLGHDSAAEEQESLRRRVVQFADELEEIDEKEIKDRAERYGETKLHYSHHKLKFKPIEINSVMSRFSKRLKDFRESIQNQVKRKQLLGHRQINAILQVQQEDEQAPNQLFDRPKVLEKQSINIEEKTTIYSIQLWKLNQGKLPIMISNIDICADSHFTIFQDSLFYSHDGNFVFFIQVNLQGYAEKLVIINAFDLSLPELHEFDLRAYQIRASEISDNPALIWGHKDSLNLEYMRQSGHSSESYGHQSIYYLYIQHNGVARFLTSQGQSLEIPLSCEKKELKQYQILGLFFENIKRKGLRLFNRDSKNNGELKDPKKMIIVVKFNHLKDPFNKTIKVMRVSFEQVVKKINEKGFLTFTDEVKAEQAISHPDFASVSFEIFASQDCKQILIISDNSSNENVLGQNSEESDQRKSIVILGMDLQQKQQTKQALSNIFKGNNLSFKNEEIKDTEGPQISTLDDGIKTSSKVIDKFTDDDQNQKNTILYSRIASIWTYREPALSKNIHVKENIRILLFNESQQQMVAVSSNEILDKSEENDFKKVVDLGQLSYVKVDQNVDQIFMNSFDVSGDQYGRQVITGFDRVHEQIARWYIAINDEEQPIRHCIAKYDMIFINPFIAFSKNHKHLIFSSMYDSNFLSFVELYSGSININGQKVYRCSACFFLTIDENAKVRLNIVKMPVYQECKSALGDCKKNFYFQKLKPEYSIDFSQGIQLILINLLVNREKIRKCILASVTLNNRQEVMVLIIQYENEVLIRPLNSTLYHDSIKTGGSKVPILAQNGQIESASGSVLIFIHSVEQGNQHRLNLLSLIPGELPKMTVMFDLKTAEVLKMSRWDNFLMILDDSMHVKRYKYQIRTGKMRVFKEAELFEESISMIQNYEKRPEFIVMSDSEVYIGPQFYQSYTNQNQVKDTNNQFESFREKNIEKLDITNLFMGPLLSQDDSMILYLRASSFDEEDEKNGNYNETYENLQNGDKSVRETPQSKGKNKSVRINLFNSQRQKNVDGSNKVAFNNNSQRINKNIQRGFTQKPNGDADDIIIHDPLKFIEIEKQELEILQERAKFQMKYEVLCIPFLGHKSIQLIHKDDYLYEQVKFSTFTMNDDVFIQINRQFYIFNGQGQPIRLIMTGQDCEIVKHQNFEIVRVQRLPCNQQSFLFSDQKKFYLFQLSFNNDSYSFKLAKEIPQIQHRALRDVYYEGKQDIQGNVYQLLIDSEIEAQNGPSESNIAISLRIDYEEQEALQISIKQIVFNNNDLSQKDKDIQIEIPGDQFDKSYKNVSLTEEDKDQNELKQIHEVPSLRYDFELLHCKYFVFKSSTDIYFFNLVSTKIMPPYQKVNLQLRPGVITQMLSTQREDLLQFVYTQYCPTKLTYIFTWDLQTNMEDSKIVFPQTVEKPVNIQVSKGVSERLNYYIPSKESCIYDLRFNFPLNYFDGISACLKWHMRHLEEKQRKQNYINKRTSQFRIRSSKESQLNELKFSSFNMKMLGLSKQQFATMYLTYSYMDLQYLEFVFQNMEQAKVAKDDGNETKYLLCRYLRFRLPNGNSILHLMATQEHFLKIYKKEVEFLINDLNMSAGEQHYFFAVYPNNEGVSPLEIAIHEHHPRSVETMLDMLSSRPKYNYSKYLFKHFYQLLEMDNDRFLQEQFGVTSEYINQLYSGMLQVNSQENGLSGKSMAKLALENQRDIGHLSQMEGFEYEIFKKKNNKSIILDLEHDKDENDLEDIQNITFTAIEFPWVFRGESAKLFIEYLKNVDENSDIFKIPTIQDIVVFQWRYFKKSYYKYKLLPFSIYFVLILIYATVNFKNDNEENGANVNNQYQEEWGVAHEAIGAILLAFATYFCLLELFKIVKQNYYLQTIFDSTFHLSVIILVILDFASVSQTVFKIFAVLVVLKSYMQLLLYLRVFDTTAVLISLIFYILKSMVIFALIFIICILAFTNCFYIIQGLQEPSDEIPPMAGGNFIMAFFYTYSGALGNFSTDNYEALGQNSWTLWTLYFISSFLLSIVLLNMLIAIMGDTYDSVMLNQREERLRAKCFLINENEFIFNRDRLFANSRYIIVANIDKATNQKTDDWDGKMNALIKTFTSKLEEEHTKSTDNFKQLRLNNQNLSELIKAQDSRLFEIQSGMSRLSDQLKSMESQKRVRKIINRSSNKFREYFKSQILQSQIGEGHQEMRQQKGWKQRLKVGQGAPTNDEIGSPDDREDNDQDLRNTIRTNNPLIRLLSEKKKKR